MSFYMPFRFMGADTVPYANHFAFRQKHMMSVDPDHRIWVPLAGAKYAVQKMTGELSVMFKKEECLDLPERVYNTAYCDMTTEQKTLYDQMAADAVAIIDGMCDKCNKKNCCDDSCEDHISARSALVLGGKLHQIASGFYINTRTVIDDNMVKRNESNIITLEENPKMKLLVNVLNNIPQDRQTIIWTNYRYLVELIQSGLEKAFGKKSCITCYGDQVAFDQVEIFRKTGCPFCIANPTKMGVGLNIQFSNYQVFFTNSHSWVQRDQAEGRQHRKGQKDVVTITDLLTRGTVDEARLKALLRKEDMSMSLSKLSRILKKDRGIKS
jgi:SNF2 family DNA or RNA helicase